MRIVARERYQRMSLEERRELIARRNPERTRANDRARYRRDKVKRNAASREQVRANPGPSNQAKRGWSERNPEKRKAHHAVAAAIRDGRLERQPCETCGTTENVHAHHDDYSKPLDVRWLCASDHAAEHVELREAA